LCGTAALGCVLTGRIVWHSRPRLCWWKSGHLWLRKQSFILLSTLSGAPPRCILLISHWREVEVEPFCGRLSTQAKSRAKPREPRRPRQCVPCHADAGSSTRIFTPKAEAWHARFSRVGRAGEGTALLLLRTHVKPRQVLRVKERPFMAARNSFPNRVLALACLTACRATSQ
jgi:hypothetical protein